MNPHNNFWDLNPRPLAY